MWLFGRYLATGSIFGKWHEIFLNFWCLVEVCSLRVLSSVQCESKKCFFSATTHTHPVHIICSKCPPSAKTHAVWSHLIRHNFVTVWDNWIKICSLAQMGTYNRRVRFGHKISNRLGIKCQKNLGGFFDSHCVCELFIRPCFIAGADIGIGVTVHESRKLN